MNMCLLPCVFKSCLLSSISSGLLVPPGVSTLPLSYLDVVIKDYYLEVYPSLSVPLWRPRPVYVSVSVTVHTAGRNEEQADEDILPNNSL